VSDLSTADFMLSGLGVQPAINYPDCEAGRGPAGEGGGTVQC